MFETTGIMTSSKSFQPSKAPQVYKALSNSSFLQTLPSVIKTETENVPIHIVHLTCNTTSTGEERTALLAQRGIQEHTQPTQEWEGPGVWH